LIYALFRLNEKRRILYHFHDDFVPEGHTSRAYALRFETGQICLGARDGPRTIR
jgi:hypothetical protein